MENMIATILVTSQNNFLQKILQIKLIQLVIFI